MVKKKLRVAVIGLGYLGKYHLEKYLKNRNVAVKWVIDSDINNLKLNINKSIKKSTNFKDSFFFVNLEPNAIILALLCCLDNLVDFIL